LEVVFSEEQISHRVQELGEQISRDYGSDEVHAIGILDNGFVFLADLVRKMSCPVICHFVRMETTDTFLGDFPIRSIGYGPIADIQGKNILLVDALVDSGITLDHLVQQLKMKKPKSVRTAALIDRESRRRVSFQVDYAGFAYDGNHLLGYGMEKNGLYRNVPYVAAIPPKP
jgi:hypoxanthine phosphoribosyltransferase